MIACASFGLERSRRSSSAIRSSRANTFLKPQVSSGRVASSEEAVSLPIADDLAHEAREQHRVARLVDLLGREEVLLLLARRGVDVGREVVGDRVLAVEEHRVGPQRAAALDLGEVSCHCSRSIEKSISVALQLPCSQRAYRSS